MIEYVKKDIEFEGYRFFLVLAACDGSVKRVGWREWRDSELEDVSSVRDKDLVEFMLKGRAREEIGSKNKNVLVMRWYEEEGFEKMMNWLMFMGMEIDIE